MNRGHCSPCLCRSSPMIDGGSPARALVPADLGKHAGGDPDDKRSLKIPRCSKPHRTAPQNRWQRLDRCRQPPRHPPPSPPAIPFPREARISRRHLPPRRCSAWQGDTNVGDAHGGGGLGAAQPQAPTRVDSFHPGRYARGSVRGWRSSSKGRTQQRERLRRASPPREKRGPKGASGESSSASAFRDSVADFELESVPRAGSERSDAATFQDFPRLPKTLKASDEPADTSEAVHRQRAAPDRGGGAAGPAAAKRPVTSTSMPTASPVKPPPRLRGAHLELFDRPNAAAKAVAVRWWRYRSRRRRGGRAAC